MLNLVYIVAPIFLIILLGKMLRNYLILSDNIWNQINALTFWVLFPCLLFNKTSVIDFEGYTVGSFSVTLIVGYLAAILFAYIICKFYGMSAASLTSVLQGAGRHNSFVALAVASQLLGEEGEMIGSLAIAIMVSFSNIATIILLTSILSKNKKAKPKILTEIARNPFIVAIAIGLSFNFMGWGYVPVLSDFTASVGKAALPIALLCVGAGLQFGGARNFFVPSAIACFAKMIILPATVFALSRYFELSAVMTTTAVIFASVPTSSSAYALAKYMGGDAPLMAAIISLQTMITVVTIPLVIILVT
ncbi:MAG: AEC family transporter [Emcibacteraceae bacterium]|nr:AEC family transporter [Emcibacteraceae bacterium]